MIIVQVSIFRSKTIIIPERNLTTINRFSLVHTARVIEFSASVTHACALRLIHTMYEPMHVQTNLCLKHYVSSLWCPDKN